MRAGLPWTFLQAGDLPEMWLRDSTTSVHHLFSIGIFDSEPRARDAVEGLARSLAHFINKDVKCSAWEPR